MLEKLPMKKPGDVMSAAHVNILSRLAEDLSGLNPASNTYAFGRTQSPHPPFRQRLCQVVSHGDGTAEDSSQSSSSSSSASSSSASGGQAGGPTQNLQVRPMYYDHSIGDWYVDLGEGPYDFDGAGLDQTYAVDDKVVCFWDPQRSAWIPTGGAGGGGTCEARNEEQSVYMTGSISGGNFDLVYSINGIATLLTVEYDWTAAEVQTELETHSQIAAGDVDVTGGPLPSASIKIEFTGDLAAKLVPIPETDITSLTGTGPGVVVVRNERGLPGDAS